MTMGGVIVQTAGIVHNADITFRLGFKNVSQLMLNKEIIAVCSEIHIQHKNTVCGKNVELLDVKLGGTYSDH